MIIRKRGRSWQLDCGMVNGRRVQLSFATKEGAQAEMAIRREKLKSSGHQGFAMSDEMRIRVMAQLDRLETVGATIEQAVDFYLVHAKPRRDAVKFRELRERCMEAKEEQRLSKRYRAQLRSVWKSFGLRFDAVMTTEITAEQVDQWLRGNQWQWRTQNNYRTDLCTLFAWGIESGFMTMNPAEAVAVRAKPSDEHGDDGGDIAFLSAEQCERLLMRAAKATEGALRRDLRGVWVPVDKHAEDYRLLVPALVIGLFAGLRPEREIGKMTWRSVSIEDRIVIVTMGRAKTRQRRTIDLSDNAVDWLKWCKAQGMGAMPDEPILPKNFVRKWKRLRAVCGLFKEWPHDGIRHTFATMHMALHKSEDLLQTALGHHDSALIYANYRGLTTPSEAARFWGLMPQVTNFLSGDE